MPDHGLHGVLLYLGIKLPDLIAGFGGGGRTPPNQGPNKPLGGRTLVIVGSLTANYLGGPAAQFIGLGSGAATFIVGLTGMAVCQGIMEAGRKWRAKVGGEPK